MNIVQKAESYAVSQLTKNLPSTFIYHNLMHTRKVVNYVKELVEGEKIGAKDAQILELAAWLHDLGYTKSNKDHENLSVEMARSFLEKEKIAKTTIEIIEKCILATTKTIEPTNKLEKVLVDADYGHIGNKGFLEASELLREEWEQQNLMTLTNVGWIEENINFLTNKHQFYTDYALNTWQLTKEKNMAQLYKLLKKTKQAEDKNKLKVEELQLKKQKARLPERGIETMFRVTLKNHITLSNIADTKANILLSVNAIIISMALSNLIPKLDNPSNHYLIIPTGIFVIFSLASMALSVLATRPNVTSGEFSKDDVKKKKVNLLFFGNFHKMKLQDFEWAMGEMMQDRDYLYSSMKKDLYFLGLVLHKKYKILRITYTIFLIGIIASVIAFAIAFELQEAFLFN